MDILETKTDIGLIRETNEDKAIALMHPKNKNIKLLAVADGMGGKEDGELASNYIVNSLERWFKNKSIKTLNNTVELEKLVKSYVKRLNTALVRKYGDNHLGSTLTLAIINKNHTLFINCGDSRGYIYKDNELFQVTSDDSDVWYYYKYGEVEKDDLRYFVNNNLINSCVGISRDFCRISSEIIENDYQILLLVSDGVTDMITDKKIKELIKKSKSEELLSNIINEAVNVDQNLSVPKKLEKKALSMYIVPFKGRDNATGAIYIKDE